MYNPPINKTEEVLQVKKITATKHKLKISYDEFIYSIKDDGYKYYDGGAYAEVYLSKDKTRAIKIGNLSEEANQDYLKFIKKVAANNQSNPLLPVVHSIKVYRAYHKLFGWIDFFVVEMERLHKLRDTDSVIADWLKAVIEVRKNKMNDLLRLVGANKESTNNLKHARDLIYNVIRTSKNRPEIDIHMCNIMKRKATGEYVITDPIA